MENQHRRITGYRELSQTEIDLMNEVKAHGAALDATIQKVEDFLRKEASGDVQFSDAQPGRWLSIGKTNLQQGLMAVTRAIARPNFF